MKYSELKSKKEMDKTSEIEAGNEDEYYYRYLLLGIWKIDASLQDDQLYWRALLHNHRIICDGTILLCNKQMVAKMVKREKL